MSHFLLHNPEAILRQSKVLEKNVVQKNIPYKIHSLQYFFKIRLLNHVF